MWIFGRNQLSPLVHTLSICLASLGSIVSAFFILTANAWMQHPVGYRIVGHGAGRKAVLTDFWAVLRNSTLWAEFSHTVLAAFNKHADIENATIHLRDMIDELDR